MQLLTLLQVGIRYHNSHQLYRLKLSLIVLLHHKLNHLVLLCLKLNLLVGLHHNMKYLLIHHSRLVPLWCQHPMLQVYYLNHTLI